LECAEGDDSVSLEVDRSRASSLQAIYPVHFISSNVGPVYSLTATAIFESAVP
jgi:hypothetical protein